VTKKHNRKWLETIGWILIIISGTLFILRVLGIIPDNVLG